MKKSCWTLFFCTMLLLTILTFGREQNVAANSSDSIDTLYKQAVTENRINPTYGLGAGPKVTNPNYCSKMVWQAFYFGTGSKKVAKGTSFFITPSSLPNSLTDAYKAYKVGRY